LVQITFRQTSNAYNMPFYGRMGVKQRTWRKRGVRNPTRSLRILRSGFPRAAPDHGVSLRRPAATQLYRTRLSSSGPIDFANNNPFVDISRNPSGTNEFGNLSGLYSQFKVLSMRVRFIFPTARTTNQGTLPTSVVFGYVNDKSSLMTISYNDTSIIRDSFETAAYGAVEYSLVLPKACINSTLTGIGAPAVESEWCDTATPNALYGILHVHWDGQPGDDMAGRVTVEYDCVFRGRQ
jgi:hypothetical protein